MKRGYWFWKDSSGSAVWLVAIFMFVIAGLLAFVIDLAHVKTVKTELSNAADTCSLRGARAFLPDVIPSSTEPQDGNPDDVRARDQAHEAIQDNKSDNENFALGDLDPTDIQVAIWDYEARDWLYGGAWQWPPDPSDYGKYIGPGVMVPTKRVEGTSMGAVGTTLARIFGISSVDVHAGATAALSGIGEVPEGWVDFPIYIERSFFDNLTPGDEGVTITNSPNPSESGGWWSIPGESPGQSTNPVVLDRYIRGEVEYPPMDVDPNSPMLTDILTQRGVDSTLFHEHLSCTAPHNHEGVLYWRWYSSASNPSNPCGSTEPLIVRLPIISDVGPASDTKPIIGFSYFEITQVNPPPDNNLKVRFFGYDIPTQYWNVPGGGVFAGILSTRPKLVK